jgi:hypothetical protein
MVQALTSGYEKSGHLCFGHFREMTAVDASVMIEAPIAKFAN